MKRFYLFLFTTITFFASTQLHCAALDRKVELKDEKEGKDEKDDKKEIQQTRKLDLSHFTITDNKEPIYDEAKRIISVAYICNQKHVKELDCSYTNINDYMLKAIAGSLSSLELLILNKCHQITDEAFIALAHCPNFRALFLFYCKHLTDKSILAFIKHKKLRILNLQGCCQITNEGIKTFAKQCTSINTIILDSVPAIDDSSQITKKTKIWVNLFLALRNNTQRRSLQIFSTHQSLKNHSTVLWLNREEFQKIIKSLETCTNIAPYQGLDTRSRLFGDIDFEHLYAALDQEEIKKQEDKNDKVAQQTNDLLKRIKHSLFWLYHDVIPSFIINGKLTAQDDRKLISDIFVSTSNERLHTKSILILTLADVANVFKLDYLPTEKMTAMIAQSLFQHIMIYAALLSNNSSEPKSAFSQKQCELKNAQLEFATLHKELEQQKNELLIKNKICAITAYVLSICLEKPDEAQTIAKQTKKALMCVNEDIAQEGYDFIMRAVSKLQEEVSNTIQAALAFNMGHLEALAFKSKALILDEDEKNAYEITAQHASDFECKQSIEVLYECYTEASFNHFQASKNNALTPAIEKELKHAKKLYESALNAAEARKDALESLQQLAQDKQGSLTRIHQQAQECIKTIKAIFNMFARHLPFNLVTDQQNILTQAQKCLEIIKNGVICLSNERVGMRMLKACKRHNRDDKEEAADEPVSFKAKRRKTDLNKQQAKGKKRKNRP